jgi:ABC-type antimicrobial peptide transport system permease subunit
VALAATGIFGIASQSVQQRRRELGIRRALGARSQQLYGMVVRQAMAPVLIGVGLGLAGAFCGDAGAAQHALQVTPTNLPVFGIVAVVLVSWRSWPASHRHDGLRTSIQQRCCVRIRGVIPNPRSG